jgi:hypothetical protein
MTEHPDPERFTVITDNYRIELPRPAPLPDPPPSWQAVGHRVNQALKRIATGVFETTASVIEGIGSAFAGIGRLPDRLGRRIEAAHAAADASAPAHDCLTEEEALNIIASVLTKYQVKGLVGRIEITRDGRAHLLIGVPPTGGEPSEQPGTHLRLPQ